MKTLAIRLEDDMHARLSIVAKLAEESLTDIIRTAIEQHIAKLSSDSRIQAKADALRAEIEREAQEQQGALSQLFDGPTTTTPTARASRKT